MKNVLKWISSFALLAIVAGFTSCGDLIRNAYVGNSTGNEITIKIDDFNGARTVLPTEFNSKSNLFYQITGESNNGGSIKTKVTFVEGSAVLVLDNYYWSLTLTAYLNYDESKNEFSNPVLAGTTTVDMRNVSGTVYFVLYPLKNDETEVKGKVLLSGSSIGSEVKNTTGYEVALYNLVTGLMIEDTKTSYSYTEEDIKGSFSYSKDVAPGEYYAKVIIKNGETAFGSWSDYVIVDPGTDSTKKDISIALAEKPAAPTEFKAVYVKDSDTPSNYNVQFAWDRTPHADEYIIYLQEKDADGNEIGIPVELSNENLYSSVFYKNGSLLIVEKGLTLKLTHGHVYEATIKAKNVVGVSDAGNCKYYMNENNPEAATTEGYISRFVITYDLNGGTYFTDKNTGSKETKYDYHMFSSENVALKAINGLVESDGEETEQEYPILVRGDNREFKEWHEYEGTTDKGSKIEAVAGNKNVTVKAMYEDSVVPVNITFANRTDISTDRMTVTYGDTNTVLDGSTLSITDNVDINVSFDGSNDSKYKDGNVFESFIVIFINGRTGEIISQSSYVNQGTTINFNTINLVEDSLEILLAAKKKGSDEYYSITKDVVITRTK